MAQFAPREKKTLNLVRREHEDTYRAVDDEEMLHLKFSGRVVPEGKMREDSKFIGSFYIERDK